MTTPLKTMRFVGISSTRQSPRHKGDRPKMETKSEEPMTLILTYVFQRVIGVPDIQLAKNAKYPVPFPPMSKDVIEEGTFLGYIQTPKYQDYKLLDPEKFPQFQANHICAKRLIQ
jgi:hypothetical protein